MSKHGLDNLMEFLEVHLNKDYYNFVEKAISEYEEKEALVHLLTLFETSLTEAKLLTKDKTQKENFEKYYLGCALDIEEYPTLDVFLNEDILEERFSDIADKEFFMLEHEFNELIQHFLDNCGMPITFHTITKEELEDL
ncbi:hypothetical protein ABEX78_32420 [Priestia megaterium]